MKTLKLTLAASLVAAAAIISIQAAEGLVTPSPAATPPQGMAGSCHTHAQDDNKPAGPVVGSPRDLSNRSASAASGSYGDAKGHCAMMNKEHASMSCCR